MHANQLAVSVDTVRELVDQQFPDWRDLEWARGKAWAFVQAMGAVWYYVESNPAMNLMGQRTLQRIMADIPAG